MRAMVLHEPGQPLRREERPDPSPGAGEVRLRVEACAVCRTDLHVVDGELALPRLPIVPGHEIVGLVDAIGEGVVGLELGDRLGVPWLADTCGQCRFCLAGQENLCDRPVFTGHGRDGGFATHVVAKAAFCVSLDRHADPVKLAPLLCAGLIGWRTLRAAGDDIDELGIYGFGAAAHLVAQVACHEGCRVHAFTRPGDHEAQALAKSVGAVWAGSAMERPTVALDAALIFAPAGELVPLALGAVRKGGRVVCGGIHMSDIPSFPYDLLWGERQLASVANLTRADAAGFFHALPHMPLHVTTRAYPLEAANQALDDLRAGRVQGAAVLLP
jgi:propanol-preferring alcohol dehydrogenase